MIRRLTGLVAEVGATHVVLEVGGIGYLIYTPDPAFCVAGAPGSFHTHLAVRENALDLYGFNDPGTLEIFELLIDLPKIGPKSALQILTQASVPLLLESVKKGDAGYLSKMSGIGKKSAEKIVAGLKDKLDEGHWQSTESSESADSATDTIEALVALGYPWEDARAAVRQLSDDGHNIESFQITLQLALKVLSK